MFVIPLLLLTVLASCADPLIHYTVGTEIHYDLHSNIDVRPVDNSKLYKGSTGRLNSWAAIRCTDIQGDGPNRKYLFLMNCFDTKVGTGETNDDVPLVLPFPESAFGSLLGSSALGKDMTFQMSAAGEVEKIWAYTKDDDRLIRIRIGVINSFATSVTAAGSQKRVLEHDPVGVHYSAVAGKSSSSNLRVRKTFGTPDFKQFADERVQPHMVSFNGVGEVEISAEGHFVSTHVEHDLRVLRPANGDDLSVAFKSLGSLNMGLLKGPMMVNKPSRIHTFEGMFQLENEGNMTSDNMFDFSKRLLFADVIHPASISPHDVPSILSYSANRMLADDQNPLIRTVGLLHDIDTSIESSELVKAVTKTVHAAANEKVYDVAKLGLYVLSAAMTRESSDELAMFIMTDLEEVKLEAIKVATNCRSPTLDLVQALMSQLESDDEEVRVSSLLALGSLAKKVDIQSQEAIVRKIESISSNPDWEMKHIVAAIGNAGESFPLDLAVSLIKEAITHENSETRAQAVNALRKRSVQHSNNQNVVAPIIVAGLRDVSEHVRASAAKIASRLGFGNGVKFVNSLMPYNVSWSKDIELGGSTAGLQAGFELFGGSNFDCNHPTFNYEALARGEVTVTLFDSSHSAALAEVVYGKINMQPLSDRILVTIWDETIYSKPLQAYDCKEHVKQIFHTAPGVSYSWVFFISVIPLEVKVSASLIFNVEWAWAVCDGDLSAVVDIRPNAVVMLSGSAQINLLIVSAGVEINGNLHSRIVPAAYVKGSLCTVGLKATHIMNPVNVDINAFFRVYKCKFWFFNCKLRNKNVYNVFHWGLPSHEQVLFDKNYKIA
ncbi:hypothetical protein P9112_002183 [Eukaryota sp. TZLM1-RC]